MGTWGIKSFENDTAADWIDGVFDRGMELVSSALGAIVDLDDDAYLDADFAVEGLAAAELVAAALKGGDRVGPELAAWCNENAAGLRPLRESAVGAVKRILARSELAMLWRDAPDGAEWRDHVSALLGMIA